jgi:hypothetical protein
MITLMTVVIGGGIVMFGMMVVMAAVYSMLVLAAEADERSEQLFELMRRERHARWNSASCACAASVTGRELRKICGTCQRNPFAPDHKTTLNHVDLEPQGDHHHVEHFRRSRYSSAAGGCSRPVTRPHRPPFPLTPPAGAPDTPRRR